MKPPQNTSHAVMAQRFEPKDSLDDFPTPPWATRALVEHVLRPAGVRFGSCFEPACGRGHMAAALCEYFDEVWAKDISDYGFGDTSNFLDDVSQPSPDWIITNPPFRLAEQFYHRARQLSRGGVALLVRTVFLESVGRLERLFANHPPTYVAQFAERVPMVKGRLDPKISTATGYAWFVWCGPSNDATKLLWIPACRKSLEQALDYDPVFLDVERLRRRGLNINSRYPGETKSPGSPSIRA